jgi:hypothetical protein
MVETVDMEHEQDHDKQDHHDNHYSNDRWNCR